ncbi:NADP-dependent oxidoreductase [Loigolactobacillus zhaoyuanensis]|uniref:NADP-dependent oxidoreductase n=1 Tax=Loigolactobacillus zhaoyuanensis TaxID=2486017 RepID=UPI000F7477EF|nr:NADP-dependent oxidoreductase [Loigolactobacillus zhaoyuanensis]
MQAMVINQFGSAKELTLTKQPQPQITATQVLVKVHAFSIGQLDLSLRSGQLVEQVAPTFPLTLGWDLAGTIVAVGSTVTDFLVGDAVLARLPLATPGAAAEYVAVAVENLAYKPANVSFRQAAALPTAGLTAWQTIVTHLAVEKNQQVLIADFTTCAGQLAAQLAASIGADVTAIAPEAATEPNFNLVTVAEATQHQYNAVLDLTADPAGIDSLAPAGHYLATQSAFTLQPNGTELQHLVDLLSHDKLQLALGRCLPFSELSLITAHRLLETGHTQGKLVIEIIAD